MDSNLLKEAIADAKAVRATALANAKVALEEAFAPRFHAMFADKLKEEASAPVQQGTPVAEETQVSEQEIDELIKELEAEVGDEAPAAPVGGDVPPAPEGDLPPVDAEVPPTGDGAPLQAGQTVKLVPVADVGADAAMDAPVPPAPPVGGEEMPSAPFGGGEDDEEVDLNELLESLKEDADKDEDEDCIKESVPNKSSGVGSSDNKSSSEFNSSKIGGKSGNETGVPEGKVTAKEPTQASRPNAGPVTPEKMSTPSLHETKETGVPEGKVTAKEPTEASRPNAGPITPEKMDTPKLTKENSQLKQQLAEAHETITYIKGQLNEINLLNAKLLYTNKLFKEFTMNNEQKMRVVEMFDLSKNVREVKLTYATIAESLNFSGDLKKSKGQTSVQSITEGMASKPVGSTKPSKEIISEGTKFASRMKQLAGIHGEPKK